MQCEQRLNERCSNKILHVQCKPQDLHVTDLNREKTSMRETRPRRNNKSIGRKGWPGPGVVRSVTNANILLEICAWMPAEVLE